MTTCDSRQWHKAFVLLAASACLLWPVPCSAQTVEDKATARGLFNEARALMGQGHYVEACPKLEAASKLYAGSGVLLNLADCYEHTGRTASAWTEFGEASFAAERAGRADDKAEADRRQTALEAKLSRLAIQVATPLQGLVVRRDGTLLSQGAWGVAVPLDPGSHTVSAEAPGRASWSITVTTSEAGKTVTVKVPELPVAAGLATTPTPPVRAEAMNPGPPERTIPSLPSTPESTYASAPYWTGRRVAGVGVAGAGVLAIAAGGALGLVAKSKFTTAQGESGGAQRDDSGSAVSTGNAATIVVAAGAVLAAAGVVIWLTAPSASTQVGMNGNEVFVRGRF
jgi:serine/threonine-protein kinase